MEEKFTLNGKQLELTWHDLKDFSKLKNVTQSSVIVFDAEGRMLIGRLNKASVWVLPSSMPQNRESYEDALSTMTHRGLGIALEKITPIGYVQVSGDEKPFQQLRFVACVKDVLEHPANAPERMFIDPKNISTYVKLGPVGLHIIDKAIEWFASRK